MENKYFKKLKFIDGVAMKQISGFPLEDLQQIFSPADFERKIYLSHSKRIKQSILDKRLLDSTITIFPFNGNLKIIDGQHRVNALYELWLEKKLQTYNIIFRIIDVKTESEARKIYLGINAGKPLTSKDILKIYDDGNNIFFNELKSHCSHYGSKIKLPYWNIFQAYNFIKTGNLRTGREEIEESMSCIKKTDIYKLKLFLDDYTRFIGKYRKTYLYSSVIFRNFYKLYCNKFTELDEKKWQKLLKYAPISKFLKNNSELRAIDDSKAMYDYLERIYER